MTVRETIGFAFLVVGTALAPLGWIVSHNILLLAGLFVGVGAWLFYTERMLKREEKLAKEGTGSGDYGHPISGDINNSTGWRTGGRMESLESTSFDGGGDGD